MAPVDLQWLEEAGLLGGPRKIRCPQCFQKLDLSLFPYFTRTACPGCGAEVMVPAVFAGFELYELLHESARSRIYRARDAILQRDIALKVATMPDWNEYYRESFALLASVEHPGILWIYTAGDCGNFTYGALQLMEQRSLGSNPKLRENQGIGKLLGHSIPLWEALRMLRERGVTHSDICPANLFCDQRGAFRLANFRPLGSEWPLPLENWRYRSPEALREGIFTPESDTFSLAVVSYELFSGHYPFGEVANSMQLLERQQLPVTALTDLNPLINRKLSQRLLAALAPEPAARPTPEELAAAIRRALAELLQNFK